MTREEMLNALHKTAFEYIDPPNFEEIGFTERPIWINSDGYGYVLCDECIECGECEGIPFGKWEEIRKKTLGGKLKIEDVENTSLVTVINEWMYKKILDLKGKENEMAEVSDFFSDLTSLSEESPKHIWWMQDENGWPLFYSSEEDFNKKYERNWCDYSWDDLDDEELSEWYQLLCE